MAASLPEIAAVCPDGYYVGAMFHPRLHAVALGENLQAKQGAIRGWGCYPLRELGFEP
jgi:hypothetical protein